MKKKTNLWPFVYVMIAIFAIGVFIYGGQSGWFKADFNITNPLPPQTIFPPSPNTSTQPPNDTQSSGGLLPTSCSDTDSGKTYNTKGTTTPVLSKNSYIDYCINSTTLKEYSCGRGGILATTDYNCPSGKCTDGACFALFCNDNDASFGHPDYLLYKDSCTDNSGTYTDVCEFGMLAEYYCTPDKRCEFTNYGCQGNFGMDYYCKAGTCVTDGTTNSLTSAECSAYAVSEGLSFMQTEVPSLNFCEYDVARTQCYNLGLGMTAMNYKRNCCVWSCG